MVGLLGAWSLLDNRCSLNLSIKVLTLFFLLVGEGGLSSGGGSFTLACSDKPELYLNVTYNIYIVQRVTS